MRIIINGSCGRMGREVVRLVESGYHDTSVAAAVDVNNSDKEKYPIFENLFDFDGPADCIIDFSHHTTASVLMDYAVEKNLPVVVATTGQTDEERRIIEAAAKKVPVFLSANMSVGIALLVNLAKIAARSFPDANIEIIEKHHNRKIDVPSGTALMLANAVKDIRSDAEFVVGRHKNGKRQEQDVGIHSLRLGNIVGEHEVILATDTQVITLKHEAQSRTLFAEGAVAAAEFLVGCSAGLYNMEDMIK